MRAPARQSAGTPARRPTPGSGPACASTAPDAPPPRACSDTPSPCPSCPWTLVSRSIRVAPGAGRAQMRSMERKRRTGGRVEFFAKSRPPQGTPDAATHRPVCNVRAPARAATLRKTEANGVLPGRDGGPARPVAAGRWGGVMASVAESPREDFRQPAMACTRPSPGPSPATSWTPSGRRRGVSAPGHRADHGSANRTVCRRGPVNADVRRAPARRDRHVRRIQAGGRVHDGRRPFASRLSGCHCQSHCRRRR